MFNGAVQSSAAWRGSLCSGMYTEDLIFVIAVVGNASVLQYDNITSSLQYGLTFERVSSGY